MLLFCATLALAGCPGREAPDAAVDAGADAAPQSDVIVSDVITRDVVVSDVIDVVAPDAESDVVTSDVTVSDTVAEDAAADAIVEDAAVDVVSVEDVAADVAAVDVVVDVAPPLTPPTLSLVAPLADRSETRRLLRGAVEDADGIASIRYVLNGAAPVSVAVTGAPTRVDLAQALPLRAGPNTLVLTITDARGAELTETRSFRYGLVTAGGGSHSGAIVLDRLYTFGRNNTLQLGLSTTDASRTTPVEVPAFGAASTAPVAIAFNQNFSMAIRSDGTLWAFGENSAGELGQGDSGTTTRRSTPTQVQETVGAGTAPITDATYVANGYNHTLVIRANGSVWAFGKNDLGQVGVAGSGTSTDLQTRPVMVAGLPDNVVKVIAGSAHSAALTADGRVYVWGRNTYGNHGNGTTDTMRHFAPEVVASTLVRDIVDIANGRDHIIAVRADGRAFSWGLGASGQLGYGENTIPDMEDRSSPTPVATDMAGSTPLENVALAFANGNTSIVLLRNGQLWGFGADGNGTLAPGGTGGSGAMAHNAFYAIRAGIETLNTAPTPNVHFDESHTVRSLSMGALHVITLTTTGALYSWGWSTQGTLGVASFPATWRQPTPALVTLP